MTRYGTWAQLQNARQQAGLRRTELADLAGVSRSYITRLEAGDRWPSPYVVVKIARALGIRPAAITRRREEPPKCKDQKPQTPTKSPNGSAPTSQPSRPNPGRGSNRLSMACHR
jgi:transcriptional regulator with XRE-family HTH domain